MCGWVRKIWKWSEDGIFFILCLFLAWRVMNCIWMEGEMKRWMKLEWWWIVEWDEDGIGTTHNLVRSTSRVILECGVWRKLKLKTTSSVTIWQRRSVNTSTNDNNCVSLMVIGWCGCWRKLAIVERLLAEVFALEFGYLVSIVVDEAVCWIETGWKLRSCWLKYYCWKYGQWVKYDWKELEKVKVDDENEERKKKREKILEKKGEWSVLEFFFIP